MSGEVESKQSGGEMSITGEYYKKVPRYLAIAPIKYSNYNEERSTGGCYDSDCDSDYKEECSTNGCLYSAEYYREWYDENDNNVDVDDETWFCKDCVKLYLERNRVKRTTAKMNAERPIYISNRQSFSRKQ